MSESWTRGAGVATRLSDGDGTGHTEEHSVAASTRPCLPFNHLHRPRPVGVGGDPAVERDEATMVSFGYAHEVGVHESLHVRP